MKRKQELAVQQFSKELRSLYSRRLHGPSSDGESNSSSDGINNPKISEHPRPKQSLTLDHTQYLSMLDFMPMSGSYSQSEGEGGAAVIHESGFPLAASITADENIREKYTQNSHQMLNRTSIQRSSCYYAQSTLIYQDKMPSIASDFGKQKQMRAANEAANCRDIYESPTVRPHNHREDTILGSADAQKLLLQHHYLQSFCAGVIARQFIALAVRTDHLHSSAAPVSVLPTAMSMPTLSEPAALSPMSALERAVVRPTSDSDRCVVDAVDDVGVDSGSGAYAGATGSSWSRQRSPQSTFGSNEPDMLAPLSSDRFMRTHKTSDTARCIRKTCVCCPPPVASESLQPAAGRGKWKQEGINCDDCSRKSVYGNNGGMRHTSGYKEILWCVQRELRYFLEPHAVCTCFGEEGI